MTKPYIVPMLDMMVVLGFQRIKWFSVYLYYSGKTYWRSILIAEELCTREFNTKKRWTGGFINTHVRAVEPRHYPTRQQVSLLSRSPDDLVQRLDVPVISVISRMTDEPQHNILYQQIICCSEPRFTYTSMMLCGLGCLYDVKHSA